MRYNPLKVYIIEYAIGCGRAKGFRTGYRIKAKNKTDAINQADRSTIISHCQGYDVDVYEHTAGGPVKVTS